MVNYIRGKVHYAKEEGCLIWFHIYSLHVRGWISIDKNIFEHGMKKRLIKELYRAENRRIEKAIRASEKKAARLMRKGEHVEAKSIGYHIHALRLKIKKDIHLHDLIGKRIIFRLD